MSPSPSLHASVLEEFERAFGPPHRHIGEERQWSLRHLVHISAVNIMLIGNPDQPIVWAFDPHDPSNGISHTPITEASQIRSVIESIQQRVRLRGQPPLARHA